ncbi:MAG: hypothetical protein IKL10_11025 [Clostridia bacterium]|nr:hypothetical protein [Clostridia bacterium]
MDRTISLNDLWCFSDGIKKPQKLSLLFDKKTTLPVKRTSSFTIQRKIICPKQVNDTVSVFFTGEYEGIKVYAGKKLLWSEKDSEGRDIFDITPALKTGKTVITATFGTGNADGFFLSVKRNYNV